MFKAELLLTVYEGKYFCGYQWPFLVIQLVTFLLDCTFGQYNLHTDKEVHKGFYGKHNRIFRMCTNSVYQASPWQGVGLDKPSVYDTMSTEARSVQK